MICSPEFEWVIHYSVSSINWSSCLEKNRSAVKKNIPATQKLFAFPATQNSCIWHHDVITDFSIMKHRSTTRSAWMSTVSLPARMSRKNANNFCVAGFLLFGNAPVCLYRKCLALLRVNLLSFQCILWLNVKKEFQLNSYQNRGFLKFYKFRWCPLRVLLDLKASHSLMKCRVLRHKSQANKIGSSQISGERHVPHN